MTGINDQAPKKTLTLGKKLDLKKISEGDQVRQSFSHGRSKTVTVEVKRSRRPVPPQKGEEVAITETSPESSAPPPLSVDTSPNRLTEKELKARRAALRKAQEKTEHRDKTSASSDSAVDEGQDTSDERNEGENASDSVLSVNDFPRPLIDATSPKAPPQKHPPRVDATVAKDEEEEESSRRKSLRDIEPRRIAPGPVKKAVQAPRKLSRQNISRAMADETEERTRSLASFRRARQKHKVQKQVLQDTQRVVRDVVVFDFITVGELAKRMAVPGADVIKCLMKLGMMVTINQTIDADTAELVCSEFGHNFKRVSDSDVEIGLVGGEDQAEELHPRAPVVTVMGHVDHGKTSLLDALRKTDVVAGEAGGITQHIGAYQVHMKSGAKITFIDTPGHAAFTEMRARGANVTDIVILVVAADDGIKEQTIEAINHAKAAGVPLVVAINKIDKENANPSRVRNELLNHEVVLEEFGGDVLCAEISAKQGLNLEKLEELVLLQAELLNLQANPHRSAEGAIIESKVDKGRGIVATILVNRGTLKQGDVFVAGSEWGRVRALINDHGQKVEEAGPATPVEVLGFDGIPSAGDEFSVVANESRAREVTTYRQQRDREKRARANARSSMERLMSQIAAGQVQEVAVVVKADVHGSLEAIVNTLDKLGTSEVSVRILHAGVGAINESDVTLAQASNGIIIGFNVRANPQALDLSRRTQTDIRYYSIIYTIIDDMKVLMGGLLAPTLHEKYLGTAEIREVFSISKVGNVAGCYVREGTVKRGASVRVLRDNIVIHTGTLKSLKRFKEEVREVRESYECGMVFDQYDDIKVSDTVECFEIESQARVL